VAYLGIDVGSLFIGVVLADDAGAVVKRAYERHKGEPDQCLKTMLADFDLSSVKAVVRTGTGGERLVIGGDYIDALVAGVEGVRKLVPDANNIISIGGGSFSLTELDEGGKYRRSVMNSACASGTGAFLDQQAMRLQVPPTELAKRAESYTKRAPGVATRCAVFAKSDMIHLQQEGFTVEAIAAGLCTGLGHSTVDGLLGGHGLHGKTAVIGGVARNTVVTRSVADKLGVEVTVPENPELVGALGAAMVAMQRKENTFDFAKLDAAINGDSGKEESFLRPPLKLELSDYPDFACHDHWVNDDKSEIAIIKPCSGNVTVSMGIDIGSTSTKAALLDNDDDVVGWIYRKTAGDPIGAVQLLFKAVRDMQTRGGFTFDIKGVGTTGSGRKMIGKLIGADLAMNEITAHATAAVFLDPQVDTIIELGGQDAKFTQLQNGMVYNSIMNYVCAAGTGSFVEEQALKLGIALTEYADRAMGKECPKTSDRCTVYMERDLDLLLAKGWSKEQVAAAVLHSVRDNYLNKVVGGLQIGSHVYFQGATARNKALVAAFEVELKQAIKVSPFCHITGSLGMCLLVKQRVAESERSKSFKGLAFADEKVRVEYETCELCHNLCNLSLIHTGDEMLAWGLKCGRDYNAKKVKVKKITTYDYWKQRDAFWSKKAPNAHTSGPKIGVLRGLGTYGYYPYYNAFLSELGCEVVFSPRSSDKILHMGTEASTAEYCAPVAMSHGHAKYLLEESKVDYLFVPHMLREPIHPGFTDAHFCCYLQAHPGVLAANPNLNAKDKILAPIVELDKPQEYQVREMLKVLGAPLGVRESDIRRALAAGGEAHRAFRQESLRLGAEGLKRIEEENAIGIVCVGRPYNTTDGGMALDLPRKIAELGYVVLYQDMLPYDLNSILPEFANMYWHYGQKILASAQHIAKQKRLFGVYFTNFMCGPDSYIMTYFKEVMGRVGKPYLCLQFDGHGADAGYLTRVEAALESFHSWSGIPRPQELAESKEGVTVGA